MTNEPSIRHRYRLFGGVLESDLAIPELEAADPAEDMTWVLRSRVGEPPEAECVPLGSDTVTAGVETRLYRTSHGFRLVFDDTGCFDIAADGRTITWTHAEDVSAADARADISSRVLATALYAAGTVCLHGSAVVLDGQAVGFVAPKRHGKSTLALALVRSGGKLLTDDTMPVLAGSAPLAGPGLHAARLWADSARVVGIGQAAPAAVGPKTVFRALPEERVSHCTHPLAALYLLAPVREAPDGAAVRRTRLSGMEAALVILGHAKLAPLLTGPEAPNLFRHATALAACVPVYRLEIVRDFDRLEEAVATIRDWHAQSLAGTTP